MMRFNEFKSIKHIVPLTPAQARLRKLKVGVELGKNVLKAERESQRRVRDLESRRKLQATAATLGKLQIQNGIRRAN
jgi:hypothetical protein